MSPSSSASSSSLAPSVIVTRLRAAGCVFAEDEARLLVATAVTQAELAAMVERRIGGLPLEHVLGWAEFCGLRVSVDPGVFVPRRRTEFLVHQAAALVGRIASASAGRVDPYAGAGGPSAPLLALSPPRPVVVDLCCGSGAVGAALFAGSTVIDLYAADIDPAAVHCARRNIAAGGQVYEGDLYEPLPVALRGRIDLLVANAPYVPTEAIGLLPPEARIYESRVALDGGADGLDIQRRVTAGAFDWLAPGGHLLIETSERQAPQTMRAFADNGLAPWVVECEDLDATVVIGTKPAHGSAAASGV